MKTSPFAIEKNDRIVPDAARIAQVSEYFSWLRHTSGSFFHSKTEVGRVLLPHVLRCAVLVTIRKKRLLLLLQAAEGHAKDQVAS